jgi:hypothetical protein
MRPAKLTGAALPPIVAVTPLKGFCAGAAVPAGDDVRADA